MRQYGHPEFYRILDELKELHSLKNQDYGSLSDPMRNFRTAGRLIEPLLRPGVYVPLATALCLVAKQIDAVYDMVASNKHGAAESLEDKLKDIAVYAVLALVLVREYNGTEANSVNEEGQFVGEETLSEGPPEYSRQEESVGCSLAGGYEDSERDYPLAQINRSGLTHGTSY